MSVGLVIVSHSAKIAEGVCELAAQMAADVRLVPAGGTDAGGGAARIGTSFEKVADAITKAGQGDGVVILTDLGSAVMTAEMALEFLDEDERATVRLASAALVEGAVAAAVQAQAGGSIEEVLRAAEEAVVSIRPEALEPFVSRSAAAPGATRAPAPEGPSASGSWVLPNDMGLHARPAAVLARGLTDLDAEVTVNGIDGKSVMLLMSLGLGKGKTVSARAVGPDAEAAIELIGAAVEDGFGEMNQDPQH
ncbi:PTS-dependent dihydroxyacetone kinase phosphotransferase subunit DhaM [Arthrobacter sp. MSA 4-2]|uniref:dihydroxyacetone kinase phosphoryl donor subunit DhaM n=1 Tax=Arthrobacter sp. MSA 4-2 TaxID=2794349 RepID=UPI0018E7AF15|nr:dihydroxyacetone kinase phosphoryl donor subunit DhaM [Arthrobacter sp. MSA 4-2]MBJ2120710.1 PTS-dependent dihydroxyacetone kinase phosphotransferase subunit DhaM [Arthrobacter sp. MSA 4-2]